MPPPARWFIKTAFVFLVLALGSGAVSALRTGAADGFWRPAVVHLFVVGWLTQLIFGVAYWLFPRHSRERPYGPAALAWAAYGLLNLGLALRTAAEPGMALRVWDGWRVLLALSAAMQTLGVLAYAVYIWPRIKTR
jgi:hypothetical protein